MIPIFAFEFTPAEQALAYCLAGAWVGSLVLGFVNPILIGLMAMKARATALHYAIWVVCVMSAATVWEHGRSSRWWIALIGVPLLIISHFIVLLRIRRRLKLGR